LIVLVTLVLMVVCLGISDSTASVADSWTPDNKEASNLSGANNSSASATITIRMWTRLWLMSRLGRGIWWSSKNVAQGRFEEVVAVQEGQRTPVKNLTLGGNDELIGWNIHNGGGNLARE